MFWYVLVKKDPKAAEPEFIVKDLNTLSRTVCENHGWKVVFGGFHTQHDAEEALWALTCPEKTLSVLAWK
jgi:hypothetical protein